MFVQRNIKACIVKDIFVNAVEYTEKQLDFQYVTKVHGTRGEVGGKRREAKITCTMFTSQLSATSCKNPVIKEYILVRPLGFIATFSTQLYHSIKYGTSCLIS